MHLHSKRSIFVCFHSWIDWLVTHSARVCVCVSKHPVAIFTPQAIIALCDTYTRGLISVSVLTRWSIMAIILSNQALWLGTISPQSISRCERLLCCHPQFPGSRILHTRIEIHSSRTQQKDCFDLTLSLGFSLHFFFTLSTQMRHKLNCGTLSVGKFASVDKFCLSSGLPFVFKCGPSLSGRPLTRFAPILQSSNLSKKSKTTHTWYWIKIEKNSNSRLGATD